MATVSNTIKLNDSMGSVIKSLVRDMDMAIGSMERLDSISDRMNLGSSLSSATASAYGLNRGLDPIDDSLRRASEEQRKFNNRIRDGDLAASALRSTMATIGGVIGIQKIVAISDQFAQTSARLDLIKGQYETVAELQDKIFSAAFQSRGLYTDMAASVSKLGLLAGNAFGSNDEIIRFVELFQKMGTIGGSSASEISNAMYQLNQAMASGRLQGDEYRSIIENAPMLGSAIQDYMTNAGVEGTMKDWAADGLLTSDVIKAAMFSVADEVNAKFEHMPMTWSQVWNGAINQLLIISQPLLKFINLLANNWSILEPIVIAAGVAVLAYGSALLIHAGAMGASSLATSIHTAFTSGWTVAIFKATLAEEGLNAALMACPITWIVMGIIALVAVFYAGVAAVNKFAETSLSATGIIMGAFFVAGAFIINMLIGLANYFISVFNNIWNLIATFAEFFANVFNDPIASVARLFLGLFDVILGAIQGIAGALDTVFGSDLASAVSGFRGDLQSWADEKFGTQDVKIQRDIFGKIDRIGYGDAWNKGYSIGSDLQDKAMGVFGSGFDMDNFTGSLADQDYDVNVKDDVNLADESLQYLMDAIQQRYVNNVNLTAPAPIVNISFGDVHKDVDLDELTEMTKKKIGTEIVEYAMSSTDIKR